MLLFRFCKNTKWNFLLYLKILKIVYPSLNMDIAALYPVSHFSLFVQTTMKH